MTGYESTTKISGVDISPVTEEAIYAARAAKRAARRAAAEAKRRAADIYILIAAFGVGSLVFAFANLSCMASRGYGFAVGGELILALGVTYGLYRLWKKAKKYLDGE